MARWDQFQTGNVRSQSFFRRLVRFGPTRGAATVSLCAPGSVTGKTDGGGERPSRSAANTWLGLWYRNGVDDNVGDSVSDWDGLEAGDGAYLLAEEGEGDGDPDVCNAEIVNWASSLWLPPGESAKRGGPPGLLTLVFGECADRPASKGSLESNLLCPATLL